LNETKQNTNKVCKQFKIQTVCYGKSDESHVDFLLMFSSWIWERGRPSSVVIREVQSCWQPLTFGYVPKWWSCGCCQQEFSCLLLRPDWRMWHCHWWYLLRWELWYM